jgi:predicted DNA-binding transcriptional regulator YafY
VRAAIHERRVVRLLYHAFRRAEAEQRDIEPVSLVYFGERWQLAGYCRLRQGPRLFRLDRIDRLDVLSERFSIADRHAMPAPSDEWKSQVPEARVRFDPSVERWVRERQPFTLLREERDSGGPVFVYAMRKEEDLLRWLLAWGAAAEVLAPPTLRARVAAEAWAMFARHAATPDIRVARAPVHARVEV